MNTSVRDFRRLPALLLALALVAGISLTALPSSARAATVTPPDMQIQVPPTLISIGIDPPTGHPLLRYTHNTWDAGTGPFEIDPAYDPNTGTATFVQALYGSPSAGVWTLDHTIPLAANGVFAAPSDYQFPLTKFTLHSVTAAGGAGAVVATSPKVDYCITGNVRIGGVPNTPNQTFIPPGNCADPTQPLGWSVGWGDQYDQTDGGQPIDLSGIAAGTYILRAVADPQHVLVESDVTNNVTDTTLRINGTSVSVVSQNQPIVVPPSVSVTSPAAGSVVSGTVALTAAVTAPSPATIASLQFLLDGQPLGANLTAAPYTVQWTVGSTPVGSHRLSARTTDSAGNTSTAPVVPVTVQTTSSGVLGVDRSVTSTGRGTVTTAAFSTSAAGETLLAEVASDGPASGGQTATVSGGGLTWSSVTRANSQLGDAEIWTATAPAMLVNATITSTPVKAGYDQQLSVQAFRNSAGVGRSANGGATTGAPTVSLPSSAAGSLFYAVGEDWDRAVARVLGSNQTMVSQWVDTAVGDTAWVQSTSNTSTTAGQSVTLNDTQPTTDRWNLSAVEVLASTVAPPPDTIAPVVAIINPTGGQVVSGSAQVAASASDNVALSSVQLLLDGAPLGAALTAAPFARTWDTTTAAAGPHTLSAQATDFSGNIGTASSVVVTVQNPGPPMTCFVLQAQTTVRGTGTVTTPSFQTAMAGEVLLAFVSMDGPAGAARQSATVSGAGLTWTLVGRSNAQSGDAEVWRATAPSIVTAATVRSVPRVIGYPQDLTVVAYEGALGTGSVVTVAAATGAPTTAVTTTAPASLVFAVGHDWDRAIARTLPTGLVMLDQWVDTAIGDTSWTEYTNQATGPTGTVVRIGTTAPTTDQWNLVAVELVNSGQ
ncbi:hypothetical protein JF66_00775 [Cryobacterium sp. MLB-32]|uniref:Ig-like domain-containing protein n=1 Tax=Cryobacterium sp. MLB-32 TaxID=1529318 RepID=UPI0004E6538D|nr:Ig-like domain-containing protein [Cryobacterium sp. MLB-32]KFF61030.1 hypothetical protein JF66_00775 [Cryobacterium sp. MLB-32]